MLVESILQNLKKDKQYELQTNFWFNREFVQQDSDGKFACKQIDGSICRWDYIRKNL